MKVVLALAALAAVVAGASAGVLQGSSRVNLNSGSITRGDKLLYRGYVYKPAIQNVVQYEDVTYRGNYTTRLSYIQATEVGHTQYATATIIAGGVGYRNVTVRFTSYRGLGYYYLLDIWGR